MVADRQRLLSRGLQRRKALREPFERVSRAVARSAKGPADSSICAAGSMVTASLGRATPKKGRRARRWWCEMSPPPSWRSTRHAVFAAVRDRAHIVVHDDLLQLPMPSFTRAAEGLVPLSK